VTPTRAPWCCTPARAPSGGSSAADDPALVIVELTSPEGAAVLEAPATDIAAFLDRTYDSIPAGSETDWFDFDEELAKLSYQD
jgi:hypothetical protein